MQIHKQFKKRHFFYQEKFVKQQGLSKHQTSVHGVRSQQSQCIEEKFVKQQGLSKHQTSVHGVRSQQSQCIECNKILSSPRNLINHHSSFHAKGQIDKHKCPVCDKKFLFVAYLKIHLKKTHFMGKQSIKHEEMFSGIKNI